MLLRSPSRGSRTGSGTKLDAASREAVVVFQVDDVDEQTRTGWSVQAVGVAEEVTNPELLSTTEAAPWAPGDRNHLIRIHPGLLTGRRLIAPEAPG